MLFIKRLRITGFKSFTSTADIIFKSGITCIVGPCGSGKSNVVDAIKWVLGEKSGKTLRVEREIDIIFSGNKYIKPFKKAEVEITLNNYNSLFPLDYHEITITRRICRSGKNEYYINKKKCNLSDIYSLFINIGVGKNSYSFIDLNKISSLLTSTPIDRRKIVDDAVGISGYKTKLKEIIHILRDTEVIFKDLNIFINKNNIKEIKNIFFKINKSLINLKKRVYDIVIRYDELKNLIFNKNIKFAERKSINKRINHILDKILTVQNELLEIDIQNQKMQKKVNRLYNNKNNIKNILRSYGNNINNYLKKNSNELKTIDKNKKIKEIKLKEKINTLEVKTEEYLKRLNNIELIIDKFFIELKNRNQYIKGSIKQTKKLLKKIENLIKKNKAKVENIRLNYSKVELSEIKEDIKEVIINEFDEKVNKIFEIYISQIEDLLKSKKSLLKIIKIVNNDLKRLFRDRLKKINKNFNLIFRKLFNGGKTSLELIDKENILESGVEINVQLPGEKIRHIELLSGGDRTLCAIVLMFSIFMLNPTPFCVLDEIDSPLDEENINKFLKLLQEFNDRVQFLIISHIKRTISICNCLYGVIGEKGVSKILSLDLNEFNINK